jgi:hypothetical protein
VQSPSGIEPIQLAPRVCKKLIDGGSCHVADPTRGVSGVRGAIPEPGGDHGPGTRGGSQAAGRGLVRAAAGMPPR